MSMRARLLDLCVRLDPRGNSSMVCNHRNNSMDRIHAKNVRPKTINNIAPDDTAKKAKNSYPV